MTAPQHPKDLREPRSWHRLHRSTYVVLLVLLAILILANLPGQIVLTPSILRGGVYNPNYEVEPQLEHGWPATYSWREPVHILTPTGDRVISWRYLWTSTRSVKHWSWPALTIDLVVALAVLVLGGAGYEAWRRRRARLWQFHLSDLLAMVAVTSVGLGYWKVHADEYGRQQEAFAACKAAEANENCWQPGGPSWLRLLIGDRCFRIFDRVVDVRLFETSELRHLLRLPHLKRIECPSGEILQYLRHFPQLEALDCIVKDHERELLANLRYVPDLKGLRLDKTGNTDDADLVNLAQLKKLQDVNLSGECITDQGIAHLAGLTDLESLWLNDTKVTNAGLVHLKGLKKLRELWLLSEQVTPAGLEHLAGLKTLEHLKLSSEMDGNALPHFRYFPRLGHLNVNDVNLNDEQLAPLAEMIGLELLWIKGGRFTGRGLATLGPLRQLQNLSLDSASLEDGGLVHLQGLQKLEVLSLKSPRITDAGLVHLTNLPSLATLNLYDARITGKGLEHLKGLPSLIDLELNNTGTTDRDLAVLGESPTLGGLMLRNIPLTDESISVLVGLPRLGLLVLENTEVTDAGLLRLQGCKQLAIVSAKGSHITRAGLEKLLQRLPNCNQRK